MVLMEKESLKFSVRSLRPAIVFISYSLAFFTLFLQHLLVRPCSFLDTRVGGIGVVPYTNNDLKRQRSHWDQTCFLNLKLE